MTRDDHLGTPRDECVMPLVPAHAAEGIVAAVVIVHPGLIGPAQRDVADDHLVGGIGDLEAR